VSVRIPKRLIVRGGRELWKKHEFEVNCDSRLSKRMDISLSDGKGGAVGKKKETGPTPVFYSKVQGKKGVEDRNSRIPPRLTSGV